MFQWADCELGTGRARSGALLLGTLRVRRRQTDSVQRLVKCSFRRAARSEIHCRLTEDRCGDRQRHCSRHQVLHRMEEDALHPPPGVAPRLVLKYNIRPGLSQAGFLVSLARSCSSR